MSSTKKFFKRIERGLARCKQWVIIQYLLHRAGGKELIAHYRTCPPTEEPLAPDAPIWTCWWQGEEAMPPVAKACVAAMRRHASGHPVIVVTEQNFRDYVEVPDYILQRRADGDLDLTHFSDILRALLLSRHGGIWMDSTLLIPARDVNEFIPSGTMLWTCHHHTPYHNVSRGGWVSFFVACGRGNTLMSFIADLHLAYWRRHRRLVDYLLLDYTFAIARRYLPAVHDAIEALPLSEMGPLGKCLNAAYDEDQ